jgi:hypothetical protein
MIWVQRFIFLFLVLGLFTGILIFIEHAPYFYISMSLFFIFIFITIKSRISSTFKAILTNLAAIVLAIGLAEAYIAGWEGLGLSPALVQNNIILDAEGQTEEFQGFAMDNVLGYAIAKNTRIRSTETLGNKTIYDVIYTTNKYGLRVSPHDLKDSSVILPNDFKNVVFFGCSCTFGEGVQDNETWPFLFEEKSGGKYRSHNLAMEGYGPHQMLRILETKLLDHIIADKQPSIAIYLALPQHIIRSSCKYPYFIWDVNGPRYELNSLNEIEYIGKFNEGLFLKIKYMIFQQFARSYLISESFWIRQLLGWNVTQVDKEVFIKIILKAREIFCKSYNGKFYVVIWSQNIWLDDSDEYKYIITELTKYHVNIIETKDIFAEYENHKDKDSYLIKHDGHPNKLAYERIAEYILKYMNSNLSK